MCCQSVAAEKQLGRVRPMWHKTDTSELDQLRKKQTLLNLWQYIFSGQRLLLVHSRKSFVHGLMTSMQSTTILLCLRPFFHSEEQTLKHPNSWASLLLTKKVLGADVFTSHKIWILKLHLWDGKTFSHEIFLTELIYIFVCITIYSICVARSACLENKTCKHKKV